ncbi:hypothetical protein VTI74DRAFT_3576 [Chaetomium olivicolor]
MKRIRPQSHHSQHDPESASPSSGKRKRNAPTVATDTLLKAPVVLKPHPSTLTVKPRMLHPLMLLPREHLPLSALDLSQPQGDFPFSRLFESRIKILDLEGRLGSAVLLARSETSRIVYAVERESNGLYTLCKLGSWVDIERFSEKATVVCRDRVSTNKPLKSQDTAALPLTTPGIYSEHKRRRLAIEEIQSLVRKRSISVIEKENPRQAEVATEERLPSEGNGGQDTALVTEQLHCPVDGLPPSPRELNASAPVDPASGDDFLTQPNAEAIFQNIRAQYMEALYHSKGSLAYFAKGPLSRARAAFHLDWDSNLNMDDLVDFLKSLVMTTVLIDKKYRETVPEIVAKLKNFGTESENGTTKPKKRKGKKPKLGKDGLYPGEVDHIKRWWASHQPVSIGADETTFTATEHKYHISCLRRRETQLQMILILEILALEPLALVKGTECQLPGMGSQAASREASQELSTKKRNKHNLPLLLDVHADRLCIWQSTTLDDVKAVAESQIPAEGQTGEKPDAANSDSLRDFCVDIIIPFFSARLPGPCDALNRKLGGPVAQPPPKERAAKTASEVKPKPGAPVKRPAASKRDRDRALERALSVERSRRSVSRGPAATIALLRNATQTVVPGLKREASESSLMGLIPRADSNSLKERPSNIFSRSVSLSGAELKAQKKARVEAELKDAISALKRPNRTLAVKDFVEAAERRVSAGQLKKMKKPNRASAVQVKATPANNRYKDVLAVKSTTSNSQPLPFFDIPPSSASIVPASTLPRKFANRLPPTDRVQATPLRPSTTIATTSSIPITGLRAVQESPVQGGCIFPSSPIMARKAAPPSPPGSLFAPAQPRSQQHLAVPKAGLAATEDVPSSPGLGAFFETPLAPRSSKGRADLVVDDTPIRMKPRLPLGLAVDGGNRVSGYDELGKAMKGKTGMEMCGGSDGSDGSETGAKENGKGFGSGSVGGGGGLSIYQRLGWDTTDLDDIDDLL